MQSKATTVEQYLAELPEDRRAAIAVLRHVILKNLDKDYEERMQYGMIGEASRRVPAKKYIEHYESILLHNSCLQRLRTLRWN